MNDIPMISRSSTEITLLFISAMYIIRRGEATSVAGIKGRLRKGRLRKARLRKARLRKARLRKARLIKVRLIKVVASIIWTAIKALFFQQFSKNIQVFTEVVHIDRLVPSIVQIFNKYEL